MEKYHSDTETLGEHMAKAGRNSDQFIVRLPEGLRERIKIAADANGRSMNAEVVEVLEEAFPEIGFRSVPLGAVLELAAVLKPGSTDLGGETIAQLWEICVGEAADVPPKIRDAVRRKAAELGLRERFGLK